MVTPEDLKNELLERGTSEARRMHVLATMAPRLAQQSTDVIDEIYATAIPEAEITDHHYLFVFLQEAYKAGNPYLLYKIFSLAKNYDPYAALAIKIKKQDLQTLINERQPEMLQQAITFFNLYKRSPEYSRYDSDITGEDLVRTYAELRGPGPTTDPNVLLCLGKLLACKWFREDLETLRWRYISNGSPDATLGILTHANGLLNPDPDSSTGNRGLNYRSYTQRDVAYFRDNPVAFETLIAYLIRPRIDWEENSRAEEQYLPLLQTVMESIPEGEPPEHIINGLQILINNIPMQGIKPQDLLGLSAALPGKKYEAIRNQVKQNEAKKKHHLGLEVLLSLIKTIPLEQIDESKVFAKKVAQVAPPWQSDKEISAQQDIFESVAEHWADNPEALVRFFRNADEDPSLTAHGLKLLVALQRQYANPYCRKKAELLEVIVGRLLDLNSYLLQNNDDTVVNWATLTASLKGKEETFEEYDLPLVHGIMGISDWLAKREEEINEKLQTLDKDSPEAASLSEQLKKLQQHSQFRWNQNKRSNSAQAGEPILPIYGGSTHPPTTPEPPSPGPRTDGPTM